MRLSLIDILMIVTFGIIGAAVELFSGTRAVCCGTNDQIAAAVRAFGHILLFI